MKLEDFAKQYLDLGDYGDGIVGYGGGTYLCDAVTEIADNRTSIYYSDILKFLVENYEDVNDTINEFGWDGVGKDIIKASQLCEMTMIERDMEDHIPDIVVFGALYDRYGYDEDIPDEVTDAVYDALSNREIDDDWNGRIDTHYEEVFEIIDNALGVNDEDEEEEEGEEDAE